MRPFESILFSALLFIFPTCSLAAAQQAAASQPSAADASTSITLSAGTEVELLVTRPVWTLTAKAGDVIYAQTSFPVVLGMGIAIPAGTYVEGTIESVTRPTRRTNHAEIDVRFTKFIFANGYVDVYKRQAQNHCVQYSLSPVLLAGLLIDAECEHTGVPGVHINCILARAQRGLWN